MTVHSLAATTISGNTTMTSREIAELTGKRHADVMRDIRNMLTRLKVDADLLWHCETETYVDEQGKAREMYRMDKDTTLTLVSGYDPVVRFRIIKRWQELEAAKPTELTREQILVMALESERERMRLAQELEEARPMIQFHEEVSSGKEEYELQETCKILFNGSVTRNQLCDWMKTQGWMDKRPGRNEPTMWALRQGYMRHRLGVKIPGGGIVNVPMLTAKGFTLLRHLYRENELFISTIPKECRLSAPIYSV